jgi:transcriptional regulator with GAF, ATPase, and Fis domain
MADRIWSVGYTHRVASAPNPQAEPPARVRLEAVSGPVEGRIFSLEEGELSIGREPSNQISLLDPLVSRRHCVVRRDGPDVRLEDLDSRNSTFVNGVPVKERVLVHGDQVRVGNSIFVFHGSHDEATHTSSLRVDDSATPGGPTVILRKENAVYLQASQAGLPSSARTVRDLNVLLNFSRTLSSVRDVATLQQKVLDAVFEVAPADRAAVLLVEEGSEEFSSILGRYRNAGPEQPIQASQTILSEVMRENVAVLSNDVIEDETYRAADSLASPNVRSVLAAPMEAQGKLVGVIYVDASTAGVHFDAGLLQLVLALGNIAGLAMENARHLEWLGGENRRLQQELSADHGMIGESQAMRAVLEFISRVAGRESTVLVWGESGTGKELVARAIHANSGRANKPFVAINCAAITETLLESELFGHEKGSFTGAVSQKKGKLEAADGGTVFLDEVGELAVPLQAKLLRVLQEREFERVGGTRPIKVDIRVIAATNRDLKEASRAGSFRQDLYYRLNVVSVRMPALRERKEDIPLLANFFALRFGEKVKRRVAGISAKARACLLRYEWPGNVRELENAIERAVVLGSTELILVEDLPEALVEETTTEGEPVTALHEGLREAKKALIERAIEQAGGNYTEAAGILGVHPNHLFRLIKTLNLKPKRQRQA